MLTATCEHMVEVSNIPLASLIQTNLVCYVKATERLGLGNLWSGLSAYDT